MRTPAELRYQYTAGAATTRFLRGIEQKKILGERCPVCGKVYVPPRGSCPTDGVPTDEQVELPHKGTLTTFCVVNVPFYGQAMELPYTSGLILLDGADMPLMHLLQEVDGRGRAHRHAGRGGVGAPTTRSARRSRASATSARPASPTPRSTSRASTDGEHWPMHA